MPPKIIRRPAAREDLIEAYLFIYKRAPSRAAPYLGRLEAKFVTLAASPLIGAARIPQRQELRVFPAESHVILYRPLEDGIEIVRVLHARQNWQAILGG